MALVRITHQVVMPAGIRMLDVTDADVRYGVRVDVDPLVPANSDDVPAMSQQPRGKLEQFSKYQLSSFTFSYCKCSQLKNMHKNSVIIFQIALS